MHKNEYTWLYVIHCLDTEMILLNAESTFSAKAWQFSHWSTYIELCKYSNKAVTVLINKEWRHVVGTPG